MAQYICGKIKPARISPQTSPERDSVSIDHLGQSNEFVNGYLSHFPWGHSIQNVALRKDDVLEMHTGDNAWVSVYYLNDQFAFDRPDNACLAYDLEGKNAISQRMVLQSTFRIESRTVKPEAKSAPKWLQATTLLWLAAAATLSVIFYIALKK